METPKYKTIISVLNASSEGFEEYLKMSERISLFVATDGASEPEGMMEEEYIAQFAILQEKLYKEALEKKNKLSC